MKAAVGTIIELALKCGFELTALANTGKEYDWHTISSIKDSILGFRYCIMRDKIEPNDNVPHHLKAGWDFALWYAFAGITGETGDNDFIKIKRQTSLLLASADAKAWDKQRQTPELLRISALLHEIAKRLSRNVGDPKKFLRPEVYFIEKMVGKRPIGGLYTQPEFELIENDYKRRTNAVKAAYAAIPEKSSVIAENPGKLAPYLKNLHEAGTKKHKQIEDYANKRVSELLVVTKNKKATITTIAKGGSLPEKLRDCNGGRNIRSIANCMWSPLYENGIPLSKFSDLSLRVAKSCHVKGASFSSLFKYLTDGAKHSVSATDVALLKGYENTLEEVVALYLEIIPSTMSDPGWSAYFGKPDK